MRIAVLFSGGKDSTFALSWALQQGWDIAGLITLRAAQEDSWMFHTPNIQWVALQAEAIGLPLLVQETPGEKEKELDDLRAALQRAKEQWNITGLVAGALASDYQQERINRVCESLQLKTYAPLWHKKQDQLMEEMIAAGFVILIQSIAAEGFSEKWLGRQLDAAALAELRQLNKKYGVHIGGEGGEYESFVLNGPIFQKRLVVTEAEKRMEGECTGVYQIKKMHSKLYKL